ncbi:RidA family protein [Algicella marina]|uniref:RidA family protein n=1 Tax=Algicella marina TaxID=2683284 RepID=A0A6P1T119_9RHOB|nr:RidA family protein [Algicella marina]QHQ35431.1 RidA family protein [Algicella marina]
MIRIGHNARRSRAIVTNGTVYMGGQVGKDLDRNIEDQTRSALAGIDELLEQAGSSRDKVVHVTIWLKTMDDYDAMNAIWDEWIDSKSPPTRACCAVPMADPRILVEFVPTAVL